MTTLMLCVAGVFVACVLVVFLAILRVGAREDRYRERLEKEIKDKENELLRRSVLRSNSSLALIAFALTLSACATTTHPPMKGVFTPHFKSELLNIVSTPEQIREPQYSRIKIADVVHE